MDSGYIPGNIISPVEPQNSTDWSKPVPVAAAAESGFIDEGKIQPPDVPTDPNPSFKDFIDIINPLQHLPVIGTIYRALTGDTMKPSSQMVGDTIYGAPFGPLGFLGSVATMMFAQASGKTPEEMVMAAIGLGGDKTPATTMLASAAAPAEPAGSAAILSSSASSSAPDASGITITIPGITNSPAAAAAPSAPMQASAQDDDDQDDDDDSVTPIASAGAPSATTSTAQMSVPQIGSPDSVLLAKAFGGSAQPSMLDPATINAAMNYGLKQYQAMNRIGGTNIPAASSP